MNEIRLKNFRCFREEQTARIAPLTLLVGENSTGKTSFLAMIRALWEIAYRVRNPDFKEEPYDLGSFDEIAHHRGGRVSRADSFEAAFNTYSWPVGITGGQMSSTSPYEFEVEFGKRGTTPVPVRMRHKHGNTWIEERFAHNTPYVLRFGNDQGSWEREIPVDSNGPFDLDERWLMPSHYRYSLATILRRGGEDARHEFSPPDDSPRLDSDDWDRFRNFATLLLPYLEQQPFASAPVRSKPRRTYDPARPAPDPEGDYVPMYLANVFFQNRKAWANLKERLQEFGQDAGIFDEISIKALGKRDSEPFQVQVRKGGGGLKGPLRNLIDVGYGVSQVLPVITELLRPDAASMFLLQQPEVHLHPSAQAALGSLFCQVTGANRRIVVETHSDHLLDRVRMDIRDGVTHLKPDDVSILFFERTGIDVQIHSLRIDAEGNILNAPESYGRFFMEETARSLRL